jgi:Transposase DDE domain
MTFKTLLGYDSFNILPKTLFRSAALLRLMGFNAIQITQGFNQKGTVCPFDPDTLSQFLQSRTQTHYLRWLTDEVSLLRRRKLLTGTFLLDCIDITVESDRYEKMGRVCDKDGTVLYKGYKVACLVNLLPDHTLVTVGLMVFPLTVPDLTCGQILIRHILRTQRFGFIKTLVMDMGFLDGAWLHELKTRFHIDAFIPVKTNMNILADAIGLAQYERVAWETIRASPRREVAVLSSLTSWDSAKLPLTCCLVRDTALDGKVTYWAIVTPKTVTRAREVYDVYTDRWDLEEAFNELTCLWQYDRFYSTKWSLVLAQVFFTFVIYSLVSLYKTEKGGEIAEMGIKRLRLEHFRSQEDVVVYLEDCYAIFTVQELFALFLENMDAFARNKDQLLAVLRPPPG